MNVAPIVRTIPAERLRQFVQQAFERVGCSPNDAELAARVLMWASLRGVDTHGVRNLFPYYLQRIQAGEIEPKPLITTVHQAKTAIRLDGGGGMGLVTANRAMSLAIETAKQNGVGIATVENTHHLGPAGYFASLGIDEGMLGVCASGHFFGAGNAVGVAPINSARPMFSTNPVSFAAPAGRRPPFLLDMASATTTVNRIEMYEQANQTLPVGWAKDSAGQPTVDPSVARVVNALGGDPSTGGHKGVALSMMVAILTGVLTGGWKELEQSGERKFTQDTMGHFVAAIRIDQFMPLEQFNASLDAMLGAILASPRVNASEPMRYPGSLEQETYEMRMRDGIPIDARLLDELQHVRAVWSIPVSL